MDTRFKEGKQPFNFNDQIFSNHSNLSNLKGNALVDCKINRKDKIDLYF